MAKLVVLSEGMTGRTYELKVEKTTVGRIEDNAFQIAEASVSSHHAEIWLKGSDVVVRDLNSTNGTFIDGQQITEAVLKPGQILRLGQVQLRLESGTPQSSSKKVLDHTMVIPQGVTLNELEQGTTKTVKFDINSSFGKKTNKANRVFFIIAVILTLLILGLLVYAIKMSGNITGQP